MATAGGGTSSATTNFTAGSREDIVRVLKLTELEASQRGASVPPS